MCNMAESCSWILHLVTQHSPQQALEYQLGTCGMLLYISLGQIGKLEEGVKHFSLLLSRNLGVEIK